MEHGLGWPSPRSSSSSSQNPPPPPTPTALATPTRLWDAYGAENLMVGAAPIRNTLSPRNPYPPRETLDPWDYFHGGGNLLVGAAPVVHHQTAPKISPYSFETLESALSDIALNNTYSGRSPYYDNLDVGPKDPLPDSLSFLDRESSDFYAARSTSTFQYHNNLPDQHHYYPFLTADAFANFNSSSSSSSSNNPIPRNYGGASRHSGHPCGRVDCSCHHNATSPVQFRHQLPRHKLTANEEAGINGGVRRPSKLQSSCVNLMSLRGRVVEWAKDQNGCRILQSRFQDPKPEEIEMVLSEVIDHVPELMTHSFGNYLIQKLIEVCSEEQRSRLLVPIIRNSRRLIYICFDNHGTRAMQKLLEKLTSPHHIFQFMLALAPGVVDLIKDMNGHHVIQHCLKNFTAQQNEFLIHEVAENCFDIATDKSGCCVLQQCVDSAEGEARERLLFKIIADALQLAEDRYGNYVLQHVLELNDLQLKAKIVKQLKGSFVQLSRNKFASHVVEKCLIKTDANIASIIIYELLKSSKVADLLLDPYGNFVIQAALSASQGPVHYDLMRLIQSFISPMRTNMFGRKILEWFDRKGQKLYV